MLSYYKQKAKFEIMTRQLMKMDTEPGLNSEQRDVQAHIKFSKRR